MESLRNLALMVVRFVYNVLTVWIPLQEEAIKWWTAAIPPQKQALTALGNILRSLVGLPPSVPKEPIK